MEKLVHKIIRLCRKKHVRIIRHHVGRYMFGKECIAFSGNDQDCASLASFIRTKTGYNYRRDNLGFNMIYYFPDIADPSDKACGQNPTKIVET
jgi:hypothetical protein